MAKRFACVVLVVACVLALLPILSHAADGQASTLNVVVRHGDAHIEGINITVCHVADMLEDGSYAAAQGFAGADVDFNAMTTESSIALAALLHAYASRNLVERVQKTTDGQGRAIFTELTDGLYLVAQANPESSAYLLTPYLAAVPVPGKLKGTGWDHNVTTYPKTEPRTVGETVSISVYKVWAGADTHPAGVLVQLYSNGAAYGDCVTLNAGNDWGYVWEDLDAKETWTVDEVNIPEGYSKSISGSAASGFVITNTRDQEEHQTTLVSGQKTWKHGTNPPSERPQFITVVVMADGKIVTQRKITSEEHWSWSFRMPKYTTEGKEITYSIGEAGTVGYSITVDGYNLVNTFRGDGPEETDPNKPKPKPPETNDENDLALWLTLMGFSAMGLAAMLLIPPWRRKRNEKNCS